MQPLARAGTVYGSPRPSFIMEGVKCIIVFPFSAFVVVVSLPSDFSFLSLFSFTLLRIFFIHYSLQRKVYDFFCFVTFRFFFSFFLVSFYCFNPPQAFYCNAYYIFFSSYFRFYFHFHFFPFLSLISIVSKRIIFLSLFTCFLFVQDVKKVFLKACVRVYFPLFLVSLQIELICIQSRFHLLVFIECCVHVNALVKLCIIICMNRMRLCTHVCIDVYMSVFLCMRVCASVRV